MTESKLVVWDFVAVACYFAAVIGVGLYSMCRSNRGTVSGYFLAGRYMIWLPVGASLFASNIGSEHFIGLAGSGAAAGVAVGAFELNACIMLQLLGWLFLPVYIASGVCTLPEYMKKRFGGRRIRIYLATLSLVLYVFTKISVNLYSGALFIQQALHWNMYISVILLLVATAITTVTGGLAAVIYTDTLQAFVMVIGAFILMVLSMVRIGGYKELYYRYLTAIPNTTLHNPNATCGYPREDSWIMLRDPVHSDLPWPAFLLGQTPASIWYWCADQMMVQRSLAAKSLSHAQGGTLFAGYLKLLPMFLLVLPGMISRVLFTDEVACVDPAVCQEVCENPVSCTNIAYPKLVLELLPAGLRGVMLSVMLAALMSDLTSIFNSASTLFTMDIYGYIRKKPSVRELMIVGRVFVCLMVVISVVWIPVVQGMQGGQLFIYIQVISAYLAPPIAAVYLLSVLWKRCNEQGAFWGLLMGCLVGVARMILSFIYKEPRCGEDDTRPFIIGGIHYMYFAMFLFWLTGIVMIVVSLFTARPTADQLVRTTYWTRFDRRRREDEQIELADEETSTPFKTDGEGRTCKETTTPFTIDKDRQTCKSGDTNDRITASDDMPGQGEQENCVHTQDEDEDPPQTVKTKQIKSWFRRGYDWFCGFDYSAKGFLKREQFEQRLKRITCLKQNPKAKIVLLCLLLLLFALDIFLYIFFTSGSNFGLF